MAEVGRLSHEGTLAEDLLDSLAVVVVTLSPLQLFPFLRASLECLSNLEGVVALKYKEFGH